MRLFLLLFLLLCVRSFAEEQGAAVVAIDKHRSFRWPFKFSLTGSQYRLFYILFFSLMLIVPVNAQAARISAQTIDMDISPDSKRSVSLDDAGQISIWDNATMKKSAKFSIAIENTSVLKITMISANEIAFIRSDKQLEIWDVDRQKKVTTYGCDTPARHRIYLSADAKRLYAHNEKSIFSIDLYTGRKTDEFLIDGLKNFALSGDDKTMVVLTTDKSVIVDLERKVVKETVQTYGWLDNYDDYFSISSDSRFLIGENNGEIYKFNIPLKKLDKVNCLPNSSVLITQNSQKFLAYNPRKTIVFPIDSAKPNFASRSHDFLCTSVAQITPDNKYLIAIGTRMNVIDFQVYTVVNPIKEHAIIKRVDYDKELNKLRIDYRDDTDSHIINMKTFNVTKLTSLPPKFKIDYIHDPVKTRWDEANTSASRITVVDENGQNGRSFLVKGNVPKRHVQIENGIVYALAGIGRKVTEYQKVEISGSFAYDAIAYDKTVLYAYDYKSGKEIWNYSDDAGTLNQFRVVPRRGKILLEDTEGTVFILDEKTRKIIKRIDHREAKTPMNFIYGHDRMLVDPEGKFFLLVDTDQKTIVKYAIDTGEQINVYSHPKYEEMIRGMVYWVKEDLVVGGTGAYVGFWQLSNGERLARFSGYKNGRWFLYSEAGYFDTNAKQDVADFLIYEQGYSYKCLCEEDVGEFYAPIEMKKILKKGIKQ